MTSRVSAPTWTSGRTFFSDFDPATLRSPLVPRGNDGGELLALTAYPPLSATALGVPASQTFLAAASVPLPLPAKADWSAHRGRSWLSPVRHQGFAPACPGYSVVACLETQARIEHGDHDGLSLAPLVPRLSSPPHPASLTLTGALEFVRSTGLLPSYLEPLVSEGLTDRLVPDLACRVTRVRELVRFDQNSVALIKRWLAERGPLVSSLLLTRDAEFLTYTGGVYTPTTTDWNTEAAHCVLVVGYDDEHGAWHIQNSWGTDWGEAGFAWIAYNTCYLDTELYGMDGVEG